MLGHIFVAFYLFFFFKVFFFLHIQYRVCRAKPCVVGYQNARRTLLRKFLKKRIQFSCRLTTVTDVSLCNK